MPVSHTSQLSEKIALLQENGYFILRFLTTDLGKNLDQVLDRIQRTMAHLREKREH